MSSGIGDAPSLKIDEGEDDFKMQSENQISTANCKLSCETQKLCPEILATNCDNYWQKKCDCTLYCKKTLKFLSNFVNDQSQLAEIEDLCLIGEALENP